MLADLQKNPTELKLSDFDYAFPETLIAQEPLACRSDSRLMVLSAQKQIQHSQFSKITELLNAGDLLIANNTAVIPSRLFVQKPTGGKVEIFLLRSVGNAEWEAFLSPRRSLQEGMRLPIFSRRDEKILEYFLEISHLEEGQGRIRFDSLEVENEILKNFGEVPLPPYIERKAPVESDRTRYQTIFAQNSGAVAAPTAGLHFTEEIRAELNQRGVQWAEVTLHVGAGTFLPVKTENLAEHQMHREWYEIPASTLEKIERCRKSGGRIVAVGTTTLRSLESYYLTGKTEGWTDIFIKPGFEFNSADVLLTNFHQPKSTLLVLVSAFAGREFILQAYREAIEERYRLFSYGDAMWIERA